MWDALWLDAHLATMTEDGPYGAIRDGAIGAKDGVIAWVGAAADLPAEPAALAREVHRCNGAWITPGLIDCHTHLVFAGHRAREFEMRLEGASYEEIARAGGGIASTVTQTRAASEAELIASASKRLEAFKREGVTTIEVKSGYGLDLVTERRMLRAARALQGVNVRTTFLGLHALPPEFKERRTDYVALVAHGMLPALAAEGLVDAVDAYCDSIGFTAGETALLFNAARKLGLPVKLHAEQLSNQQGAALAARFTALSADHLEWLDDEGIAAMKAAETVAVLLPGAFYFLRETKLPPIDKLRASGVAMAVATDCNPGTSPLTSPLLALNMACTLFRMTPEEALLGMTLNAARALGVANVTGSLDLGKAADFAVWDIGQPAELCYWMGASPLRTRVLAGELI